jgi:hypothetical protein
VLSRLQVEENEGDCGLSSLGRLLPNDDTSGEDPLDSPGLEITGFEEYAFGSIRFGEEVLPRREEVLGEADGYPPTLRLSERFLETLFVDGSTRPVLAVGRSLSPAGLLRVLTTEPRLMASEALPVSPA